MSRKWERLVRKNAKSANKWRAKQGKPTIADTAQDVHIFKGRSVLYTLLLLGIAIFLAIFETEAGRNGMYWFTVISYFTLAALIFLWRRPYLKIGKNYVATRKLTGEKRMEPGDIEQIIIMNGYVVLQFKGKGGRWVFAKLLNRFDTSAMAKQLAKFAAQHQVPLKDETQREGAGERGGNRA